MWSLLLVPLLFYLAILGLMFVYQGRMIFPAGAAGGAGPLPPGAERIDFRAPGGETLHGIHIPPAVAASKTLVLGFGGNAWNAEAAAAYLHDVYPEADVVAFHYRGYRPSTGTPSAEALIEDAALAHDLAIERVRPKRTVAVGFSIGSGVAASLAGRRPLDGIVLVTPFDSLKAVAAGHYPWFPIGLLFRHEMKPAEWLSGSDVPVAIVAGARDTLIPPARTDALRRAVRNLALDRTLPGAGHNDIYDRPDFRAAMREALDRLTGA
jgi:hypothetical protein